VSASKWKGVGQYEEHPAVIDGAKSKIAKKEISRRTADGTSSTYLIGVDHKPDDGFRLSKTDALTTAIPTRLLLRNDRLPRGTPRRTLGAWTSYQVRETP